MREFLLESRVSLGCLIRTLEFIEGVDQRLGDESPAEFTVVGAFGQGQLIVHAATNSSTRCRGFAPVTSASPTSTACAPCSR